MEDFCVVLAGHSDSFVLCEAAESLNGNQVSFPALFMISTHRQ